jgi:hypothetical protein
VLDLDETRVTWCSKNPILDEQIHIYGWLHIQRRGDLHLVHLPVHQAPYRWRGPLLVLDGTSGRFVGAVDCPSVSTGDPRAGDLLVLIDQGNTLNVALRGRTDALAEAETLLGSIPR